LPSLQRRNAQLHALPSHDQAVNAQMHGNLALNKVIADLPAMAALAFVPKLDGNLVPLDPETRALKLSRHLLVLQTKRIPSNP